MVKQGIYIYAWPSVSYADIRKFFDKLTVKPKSSESAAVVMDTPYHNELKFVPAEAGNYVYIRHFRCVCLKVLSLFRRPPFLLSKESRGTTI